MFKLLRIFFLISIGLHILSGCGNAGKSAQASTASPSSNGVVSAKSVASQESGEPVLLMVNFIPGL